MSKQFAYLMPDNKSIGTFNPEKVIRSIPHGNVRIVLLDDGHEESLVVREEGKEKDKNGKLLPEKRERQWMISQIELNEKDSERFINETCGTMPEIPKEESVEKKEE